MYCHVYYKENWWLKPLTGFLICIALGVDAGTGPLALNPDMSAMALATITLIGNEQYAEAKDEARKIMKRYPAHPAGYFFMAAVIDSWMAMHFTDKQENEFYRFCDQAIEKGERALEKNPDDEWAKFFMGGAEGYKGTYEARFERWITAFRYGWKGVSILMQLKEDKSSIPDLNYGIGCYEYWRSALMKSLWWMPGVEDKRQSGIEKLIQVRKEGVFTGIPASAALVDIYINEKKNEEALAVAENALVKCPKSLMFVFGKGKALYKLKKYAECESVFKKTLSSLENDPDENRAGTAFCHYWIAKCEYSLEHYTECIAACDRVKAIAMTEDCRKIMQKYYSEIEDLRKKAAGKSRK